MDNAETQEKQPLQIVIELREDNSIEVKGLAIKNEPVALWLLDKAKDMIKMQHMQNAVKHQEDKKIISGLNFKNFLRKK